MARCSLSSSTSFPCLLALVGFDVFDALSNTITLGF
jgi:hypothetical protein